MEKNYRIKKHANNYTQKQALEPLKTAPDGVDTSRTDIKRARKRAAISVLLKEAGVELIVAKYPANTEKVQM